MAFYIYLLLIPVFITFFYVVDAAEFKKTGDIFNYHCSSVVFGIFWPIFIVIYFTYLILTL